MIRQYCDQLILIHDFMHKDGRGAMIWRARRPESFQIDMSTFDDNVNVFDLRPPRIIDRVISIAIHEAHKAEMIQVLNAEDLGDAVRRYWGQAEDEWIARAALNPHREEIERG